MIPANMAEPDRNPEARLLLLGREPDRKIRRGRAIDTKALLTVWSSAYAPMPIPRDGNLQPGGSHLDADAAMECL
jgi:hypothetical protein